MSAKFALKTALPTYLYDEKVKIEKYARDFGLDFFPTLFEVLSYDQMNEVASYGGFPNRYPHWRFGMEFEQLSKSHEYGLSKIYEMVINNTPSVAYLLEGNSIVEQKLVMSHVLGHVDFFKNNFTFKTTNQGVDAETGQPLRKWIDTMANDGSLVRRWIKRIGIEKVEEFIDNCLSLENLIDPQKPYAPIVAKKVHEDEYENPSTEHAAEIPRLRVDRDYMREYINPESFLQSQQKKIDDEKERERKFPEKRDRDVLGFLIDHAPLDRWEHEILGIIRREAYYFAPQMQTKIMNEGWATYWHSKIMTEKACDSSEIIDYADRTAGVLATAPGQFNPYKLGVELFRHIEERWNRGQFGKEWEDCDTLEGRRNWDRRMGAGREKVFEVRAHYNDITFIDEFLTPEFVIEQKMYAFGYNQRNERYEIETRKYKDVKEKLLFRLTNGGQPFIYVEDANHANRGELLLQHDHQGLDLKLDYAREVLKSLVRIWKRPVEIHTIIEEKPALLRFDGTEHVQRSR
ncbi:MAG: SpoVR family protein [Sandaracinaceae bacterium]|jgi:stage V sporulation protein R|nr:SpoVR family protein [Sandaracinaceae bacterium]